MSLRILTTAWDKLKYRGMVSMYTTGMWATVNWSMILIVPAAGVLRL